MDYIRDIPWLLPITFLSIIPLIYWQLTRNFQYWTKRGIKGPKPYPWVGTDLYQFFKPTHILDTQWLKTYGNIYGTFNMDEPVITIAKPELIQQVLVKDFHVFADRKGRSYKHPVLHKNVFYSTGDDWKRLRSIISPTFTSGKMRKMYHLVGECLQEYIEILDEMAVEGRDVNIKYVHTMLTLDVIARCAFATKTNTYRDPNNPLISNGTKVLNVGLAKMAALLLLPRPLKSVFGLKGTSNQKTNDFLIQLTRDIIEQRKGDTNGGKKYNDFIQLMVDAELKDTDVDESDANEAHHLNEANDDKLKMKSMAVNAINKKLTMDEMVAQAWVFFLAGSETTSNTLGYGSYELALNPHIQDRLYKEIVSSVDSEGEISYDELAKLPLLDAVISETLRLYPSVVRLDRKAKADYRLADTGITIEKGKCVEIPVYAIHRSEEYYENAHQFDPDRFMPQNRHKLVAYTYLPFGAGPHNCIGMRFALMEVKLAFVHIIQRFRFVRTEQTSVPLEYRKAVPFLSATSVVVGIQKR